ncbi:MAG: class E sortase [Acidobacteria bacterium]|nr:class E sortase [Acidobacteriota bacterium]
MRRKRIEHVIVVPPARPVAVGARAAGIPVREGAAAHLPVPVAGAPSGRQPDEGPVARAAGTASFLLDALRRRRGGRVFLWGLVAALALSGSGLLLYPFYTHWQARRIQGGLEKQFDTAGRGTGVDAGVARINWERDLAAGKALTRIRIPRLRVSVIVVEGVSWQALKAGAGHYPGTALPGEPGNVAIAGHRTGFGQPFRHLERMRPGDRVILETPFGVYTYEVVPPFESHGNPWLTGAKDFGVIQPTVEPSLTLTTCDPPGTSRNRLIVRARLIQSRSRA